MYVLLQTLPQCFVYILTKTKINAFLNTKIQNKEFLAMRTFDLPHPERLADDIRALHPAGLRSTNDAIYYTEEIQRYRVPPEHFEEIMSAIDDVTAGVAADDSIGDQAVVLVPCLREMKAALQEQIDTHHRCRRDSDKAPKDIREPLSVIV